MAEEPEYDAFLSYSHALDQRLAPAVQNELQSFAKPWYRRRSLRIFRDRTNLAADPGLWASIEQALRASRWFILLASPEAARSQWVAREVEFWLREKSADTLLIVLAGGELVWGGDDIDWSRTDALPEVLRGAFHAEPRWVDLSWLSDAEQVDRANPRFRECIADLAAPLRDMSKDELIGEHIQHHRRNLRTAWGAVSALAMLLVVALVATAIAVNQGNLAQERADVAMTRLLASAARENLSTRLDLGQLLAVEAYRMRPGPETSSALLEAVTATPQLVGYHPAGSEVTALSSTGDVLVAGTKSGRILRWDLAGEPRRAEDVTVAVPAPFAVEASADGTRLAATDGNATVVVEPSSGRQVRVEARRAVDQIALSADGRLLASTEDAGDIVLHDAATGAELRRAPIPWEIADPDKIAFLDDQRLMLGTVTGSAAYLALQDLRVLAEVGARSPQNRFFSAYSPNGDFFGFAANDPVVGGFVFEGMPADERTGTPPKPQRRQEFSPRTYPEVLAVAAGGSGFAVAVSGLLQVFGDRLSEGFLEVPGNSQLNRLSFSGDGRYLAGSTGDSVVLWDLDQTDRLAERIAADEPDDYSFIGKPDLAVDPGGENALVLPKLGAEHLRRVGLRDGSDEKEFAAFDAQRAIWVRSGESVLMASTDGTARLISAADPADVQATWDSPGGVDMSGSPEPALIMREVPGDRVVVVDQDGRVVVRSLPDGEVLQDLRGPWPQWLSAEGDVASAMAISPSGEHVALIDRNVLVVIDLRAARAVLVSPGGGDDVEFTPAGELLVQRSYGQVEVWNVPQGSQARTLEASDLLEDSMAVSADGRYAAGVRGDGLLVLLDLASGGRIGQFSLPQPASGITGAVGRSTTIAFTPDSRELLSLTSGGELLRWPLDPRAWAQRACAAAGRDLTPQEWRQVTGTEPPADLRCMR
ncbi:TIR domain-containing protein [Saccharopolyspora sp. NPDC050642]|uniref:TIR domain-containing protein n=1 Tax=Saccharopolyspora sp. NPDC050642 TaxID=3157099 RepID=UPI0033E50A4E